MSEHWGEEGFVAPKPTDDWCAVCGRQTPHAGMSDAVCDQCRAGRDATIPGTVRVVASDLAAQTREVERLREQVTALQARCTALVEEKRALDWCAQLRHMFRLFDQEIPERPAWPSKFVLDRRVRLIREEAGETYEAIEARDMPETIDGFIDLAVVALGGCLDFGVDPGVIWAEVMRANHAKAGGPKSAEGKQQKPAGWRGPEIERLLRGMAER
jgi:predicted HAD superfamily Cof-like phosphohydrolase